MWLYVGDRPHIESLEKAAIVFEKMWPPNEALLLKDMIRYEGVIFENGLPYTLASSIRDHLKQLKNSLRVAIVIGKDANNASDFKAAIEPDLIIVS